jgi:hypothetical protein
MHIKVLYTLFTNDIRTITYFLHPQLRGFRPALFGSFAFGLCPKLSTLDVIFATCAHRRSFFVHCLGWRSASSAIFATCAHRWNVPEIHLFVPKQQVKRVIFGIEGPQQYPLAGWVCFSITSLYRKKYNLEALCRRSENTFPKLIMTSTEEKLGVSRGNIFGDLCHFMRVFQYKSSRGGECRSHLLPSPIRCQNFLCIWIFPSTSASVACLGWTTFRETLRLAQMVRIRTTAKLITPTSSEARQDTLPIYVTMRSSSITKPTAELSKDRPSKPSYIDIGRSTLNEKDLQSMRRLGYSSSKVNVRLTGEEMTPKPGKDEVVIYKSFFKVGLRLPMYKMIVKVLQLGLEKKLEARKPARARSGSTRLGEAREPKRARAEPNSTACYTNEPSRLEARSKLL